MCVRDSFEKVDNSFKIAFLSVNHESFGSKGVLVFNDATPDNAAIFLTSCKQNEDGTVIFPTSKKLIEIPADVFISKVFSAGLE